MSTTCDISSWAKAIRYAQDLHDISTLNYFSPRFSTTDSIFKISLVPYGDEKNIYPLEFKDDGSVYLVSPKLPIDTDLIWMVKIQFNMDLFEYSDALAYYIKPEYEDNPILLGKDTLSFLSYDYNALFESGVIAYPSGITIPVYSLNNKDKKKLRETDYMIYPKANMATAVCKDISICNFTSWCDVIGEAGIKYYNIKKGTAVVENDACICNRTELGGDIEVIGDKIEQVDGELHTILTIRTYNKHSGNDKKDEQ